MKVHVNVDVFWKPEMSDVARSIMMRNGLKHKLDELNAWGCVPDDVKTVSLFIERQENDGRVFVRIFFDELDPQDGELVGFYLTQAVR